MLFFHIYLGNIFFLTFVIFSRATSKNVKPRDVRLGFVTRPQEGQRPVSEALVLTEDLTLEPPGLKEEVDLPIRTGIESGLIGIGLTGTGSGPGLGTGTAIGTGEGENLDRGLAIGSEGGGEGRGQNPGIGDDPDQGRGGDLNF